MLLGSGKKSVRGRLKNQTECFQLRETKNTRKGCWTTDLPGCLTVTVLGADYLTFEGEEVVVGACGRLRFRTAP